VSTGGLSRAARLAATGKQKFRWATLRRRGGGLRVVTRCVCAAPRPRPATDGLLALRIFRSTGMGCLFGSLRAAPPRAVGEWRKGELPDQKYGAVYADRLAENLTARPSGIFIGALSRFLIKRKSPLHQSAGRKKTAVGPLRPQILE